MTVKVGEVINQLRNIIVFGIVLCAIWILASLNIEGSQSQRLLIQDFLAYLTLGDSIRKATAEGLIGCLRDARIGAPCSFVVYHPWLGKAIHLDAIRLDIGQFEPAVYSSTGIKYWKSDKAIFDLQQSNDTPFPLLPFFEPKQLWELKPGQATDLADPILRRLISDYAIVVDVHHGYFIAPVSLLKFDSKLKVRTTSRYYEETDAWIASLGQGYPTRIGGLTLNDPMLSKLVHDYYRVENMRKRSLV